MEPARSRKPSLPRSQPGKSGRSIARMSTARPGLQPDSSAYENFASRLGALCNGSRSILLAESRLAKTHENRSNKVLLIRLNECRAAEV